MKTFKKILFVLTIIFVAIHSKLIAQENKSFGIYNNRFVNNNLYLNDTIYGMDYNNIGLVLYHRGQRDTITFSQAGNPGFNAPCSLITWEKQNKYPKYNGSIIIFKTELKLPWTTINNWSDNRFHNDHYSHLSHYSQIK